MKNRFLFLFGMMILTLVLFVSCTAKSQKTSDVGLAAETSLTRLFEDAGLHLLREPVNIRDFTLSTPEGINITLSALQGKVVFLNFWATWCSPCRVEMPSMETLYQRFKDQGLEILAVNIIERPDEVLDFMQLFKLSFPVPLDRDGAVGASYGVQGIPTSFLINREGKIVMRHVGTLDWDTPETRAAFEGLLSAR